VHLAGNRPGDWGPGLCGVPSHRPALIMTFVNYSSLTDKQCGW
jgi:hypothetical protein